MPLLGFKRQFADFVECGSKAHTVLHAPGAGFLELAVSTLGWATYPLAVQ